MRIKTGFIPSLFTILNLFTGFFAVTRILVGNYIAAATLIILAAVFDTFDGKVARLLGKSSRFGIEFDSLADIVSFCLAPSLLVYSVFLVELGIIGAMISFFPLLFGSLRLAKFNVITLEKGHKPYFVGMPVPVNAILISSFLMFNRRFSGHYGDPRILLPLIVTLSFLMVSKIRFSAFPLMSFRRGALYSFRSALCMVVLLLMVAFPSVFIFPFFMLFVMYHVVDWINGYEEPRFSVFVKKRGEKND
ncbi:MAG TPA: CDP-diacylglycerol--serine O-phosphatidyltransferase [Candidatus Marinimicrobia bacterium]|nr:CDP-diacylglycerol--serine O-phosphatidyltransferase [Candidatus Neomarinimicrobiota bacterium]